MGQFTLIVLYLLVLGCVWGDEHNHKYRKNEEVVAWMNTVGPIYNRQETYPYYQLPFCHGNSAIQHHHETLGEALQGMDLINSGISIRYLTDSTDQTLCSQTLDSAATSLLRAAIANKYWFTMFIDDLPLSGSVGLLKQQEHQGHEVYTHKHIVMEYNQDRIISAQLIMDRPVVLSSHGSQSINFTYSIQWKPTDIVFEDRFRKLLETDFFEHKVHWLSIFSSFMMVLSLTGLVSIILLRTVKSDYARYDREEGPIDFDRDFGDDYGWKQVHGDVFRQPPRLMFLSAFMGTGSQLVILAAIVILYTIVGGLYAERATILTTTIFLYAFTSLVSGYTSARYYTRWGGKDWVRNVFLTAGLWPATVVGVSSYVNSIAIYYASSRAIAFSTILAMLALWLFVCFPLTLLGAIVGRRWTQQTDFPCRVNPIPRPIPEKLWYAEPLVIIALGGILPFGSIFIEIYFIFTSFWTYKIYYVYGFMLLVFCILLIVCACVAIVSTYFLLNSEDHRWHWVSFMTCASTSAYIYLYSIYYYYSKTKMTGFFQTSFYFGYTAILALGMFFMLGYVGHSSASLFVRKIYQSVKID
ncbi:hypothetical protein BDF14DRAFT_1954399 [Spinellus fusiger]|nr:hypothetical protein BDF14DRAFT_1954399 [Spinellus fusiger]